MMSQRAHRRIARAREASPYLVALLAFSVYLRTLSPTVGFIDAGELSAVASTLGIAHPTGYPLFTLLGWLFSHLPIAREEVVRLNIMAALFCAAAIPVFVRVVSLILGKMDEGTKSGGANGERYTSAAVLVGSAGAGLLLAFSEAYWLQAVSVEVYSLHLLLLSLTLWLFLKANLDRRRTGEKWWWIFAFVLGLSFTNHMTTILLGPGLLYCYFAVQGWNRQSWARIVRMSLPFLLGLSLYAYLPLRAAQAPLMNWGNPVNLERFLWHVTGKQFRVWLFSSTEVAGKQLRYFLGSLPEEEAYVGLGLALIGAVVLWLKQRRLFVMTALLLVTCVLYSINYDIHDIDSYFLLAYVAMTVWSGAGLFWCMTRLSRWWGSRTTVPAALLLLLCLAPLAFHYARSDESNDYLVEDYTHNMFSSLQSHAIVLSYQWDYWLSASFYYQLVKGERPDLVVIDKELLRRSWYFRALEERYPWLIRGSRQEVDGFLHELDKFEHGIPYDPELIEARYAAMIASFIGKNVRDRPVYVTGEIEQEYTRGYQRVPAGLAFRLYADTLFHDVEMPQFRYRPLGRNGRLEDFTRRLYAEAWTSRGVYYYGRRRALQEAKTAFQSALSYDPSAPIPRRWLALLDAGAR